MATTTGDQHKQALAPILAARASFLPMRENKTRASDMAADSEHARIVHQVGPSRFIVVGERALLLAMSLTGFCLHSVFAPERESAEANAFEDYMLTPAAWGSITMLQTGLFIIYFTDRYCDPHLSVMWDAAAVCEYLILLGVVSAKGDKHKINYVIPPLAAAIHIGTLIQDAVWILRVRNKLRTRIMPSSSSTASLRERRRAASTECLRPTRASSSARQPSPSQTHKVAYIQGAQGERLSAQHEYGGRSPIREETFTRSTILSHLAPPPQPGASYKDIAQVSSELLATASPVASPQPSTVISPSTVHPPRHADHRRRPRPWWWTVVLGMPSASPVSGLVHSLCSRSGNGSGRRAVRRRRRSHWHTRCDNDNTMRAAQPQQVQAAEYSDDEAPPQSMRVQPTSHGKKISKG